MTQILSILNSETAQGRSYQIINILNKQFVYSDKRGFSMHTIVDQDFAYDIVQWFEAEVSRTGVPILYLERLNGPCKISWSRCGTFYVLKLHCHGDHIFTSKKISI